jgi:hypothetical protein
MTCNLRSSLANLTFASLPVGPAGPGSTTMSDLAIVLVDYDNVRLRVDRNPLDANFNAAMLTMDIIWKIRQTLARPREYHIRLYGGWIDELGQLTSLGQWLLVASSALRGRKHGVLVKPQVATSVAIRATEILIGTTRKDTVKARQKMVDCMIAVDLLHYSRSETVVVVSDDDDLVPAVFAATVRCAGHVVWLRHRHAGWGLNDSLLTAAGVRFGVLKGQGPQ